MNILSLLSKLPPDIAKELSSFGDIQEYVPIIRQFITLKNMGSGLRVADLQGQDVQKLMNVFGAGMNDRQSQAICDSIKTYCVNPDDSLGTFLASGGLIRVLTGIATPSENSNPDNAIRCPHCAGLIIRAESLSGFDDVLVCQHCGGTIINQ